MVNTAGMSEQVQFISITTDPMNDSAEVLANYGERFGLDPSNRTMLTKKTDRPDSTRKLALDYGLKFTMTADSDMQMHAAIVHIIDRCRFVAKFHGMKFQNTNAVLYTNGLVYTNHTLPIRELVAKALSVMRLNESRCQIGTWTTLCQ